uniref:ABC transporter ATP-binding protein n=1 Tax=Desulfacinum infernum TaxID=35837 RepID=A0A832EIE9_9BACT
MLTVKSLHAYYGNIHALKGVSLHVRSGEIVTLIGANGAGKTTLVHSICGLMKPAKGAVLFEESDLTRLTPEAIVRRGISLVPEGRQIFATLSVEANLEMGAFIHRKDRQGLRRDMDELLERFPVLRQRRRQLAGTLSGGEQQMLAICRALMARPRFLLLDEPSMGLAPLIVREIFDIILELRREGRTILLIEQNARAALQIADRGYVLETGKIVLQGEGRDLLAHREVQRAYLGKGGKPIWDA